MIGTSKPWKFRIFTLALLALFFIVPPAHAQVSGDPVWKTEHDSWLDETSPGSGETWKNRYASWIQSDLTPNIFTAPDSPLYGTKVDCSSAAEALFILFAYENHLPFYLPSANPGKTHALSNEMPFGQEGKTGQQRLQRFRTFVNEAISQVNTSTVSRDTFPVNITKDHVKAGLILLYYSQALHTEDGQRVVDHTHTLTNISSAGVPSFLSASSDRSPQVLAELRGIQDPPYTHGQDGLRDWKTYRYNSQMGYTPERMENVPGSREYAIAHGEKYVDQFQFPRDNFGGAFEKQMGGYSQSDAAQMKDLYVGLCDSIHQRETYVNDSNKIFAERTQCPTSTDWEQYSTVAKDERIWKMFKKIDSIVKSYRPDQPDGDLESYDAARNERDKEFRACHVDSVDPRLNLLWLREIFMKREASADPFDADSSASQRWGFDHEDLSQNPPSSRYDERWPNKYDQDYIVSKNSRCALPVGSKHPTITDDNTFEKADNRTEAPQSNYYHSLTTTSSYQAPVIVRPIVPPPVHAPRPTPSITNLPTIERVM